ncbi:MAG: SDR family NAD(P)-dependent oxidoreductase [Gammaproteobacteria bacterium]|nr:SDR family NAD(P)-dependent oxidoreductase [Gammaproteobacteria bacterium]
MNWQQLKKVAAFYGRFTLSFTQIGHRARRLGWDRITPDFRGQTWLVTGASGGLGGWIATEAARHGATVIAAARSAAKLEALRDAARAAGVSGIEIETCDFSLQADTARLVGRLQAANRRIDVLVNNVGVLNDDLQLTSEGREASFTISLLSHYLLTEGLVRRGLLCTPGGLVINMTSGGGYNAPLGTAFMNITEPAKFNGTVAYAFHKRGQMVLNQYWRDTYGSRGLTFYVMHPGWADTEGVKRSLPRFRRILKSVLRDAASGGDTAIWLAATRPPQPEQELVWFDRAIRPAHVYARTRATRDTPQSLVAYLEKELDRFPDSRP